LGCHPHKNEETNFIGFSLWLSLSLSLPRNRQKAKEINIRGQKENYKTWEGKSSCTESPLTVRSEVNLREYYLLPAMNRANYMLKPQLQEMLTYSIKITSCESNIRYQDNLRLVIFFPKAVCALA
jgi:hypothetical protein